MRKLFIFFMMFLLGFLSGQNLSTILEKDKLKLGEENTLIIKIAPLQMQEVITMPKNELLPFHMEEISDSIATKPNYFRKIKFAIYDLGEFKIPILEFKVGNKILKSSEYTIKVVASQQNEDIDDIMNIKSVNLGWKDYYQIYKFYILGALLLFAIFFLVWNFFKKGKKIVETSEVVRNRFLKKLFEIENKKYIENSNYRNFYIEIIDVCRDFIDYEYKYPAKILLTEDLLTLMSKSNRISKENQNLLEKLIKRGDAMKFAIKIPTKNEMKEDIEFIKFFVKNAHIEIENENLRNYE